MSFDASSLMRSQTVATMEEAGFPPQSGVLLPSHSSERLIDSSAAAAAALKDNADFAYLSEMLPPELARQIMLGKNGETEWEPADHKSLASPLPDFGSIFGGAKGKGNRKNKLRTNERTSRTVRSRSQMP